MTRIVYLSDQHLTRIDLPDDDSFIEYYGKPMYGGVFGAGNYSLVGIIDPFYTLPTVRYLVMHTRSGVPVSKRHETKSAAIQEARANLRVIDPVTLARAIDRMFREAIALRTRMEAEDRARREARASEEATRARDPSGHVYLIRCDDRYKIGKAVDVDARLRSMMLPSKPEIIATGLFGKPYDVERELHQRFKARRENGEWFRLTPDEVELVKLRLQQEGQPKLRAVP